MFNIVHIVIVSSFKTVTLLESTFLDILATKLNPYLNIMHCWRPTALAAQTECDRTENKSSNSEPDKNCIFTKTLKQNWKKHSVHPNQTICVNSWKSRGTCRSAPLLATSVYIVNWQQSSPDNRLFPRHSAQISAVNWSHSAACHVCHWPQTVDVFYSHTHHCTK